MRSKLFALSSMAALAATITILASSSCSSEPGPAANPGGAAGAGGAGGGGDVDAGAGGSGAEDAGAGGDGGTGAAPQFCPAGTIECDPGLNVMKVCDGKGGHSEIKSCGKYACVPGKGCEVCKADAIECAGTVKKVCDGQGGYKSEEDCAPQNCSTVFGCIDCKADEVQCEGTIKKICDGAGGYKTIEDCALSADDKKACAQGVGCVVCVPGTGTCNGEVGTFCKDDASGFDSEICDPVQGTACDPTSGRCIGLCGPKELGRSYIGCDYYPTITANAVETQFNFAVAVSNTSDQAATITITGGSANVNIVDSVAPHSMKIFKLPWDQVLKGPGAGPAPPPFPASVLVPDGAYRVRSNVPVTVYQFNPLEYEIGNCLLISSNCSYSNDASLLLPANAWTGRYFVASYHTGTAEEVSNTAGFYAVTAAFDGTHVKIVTPPGGSNIRLGNFTGLAKDGNGELDLNAGDVLEVITDFSADTTGTYIEASRPVQVIGGHQCPYVPDPRPYCDHIEESIFPYETLSDRYFVTAHLIPTLGNTPVEQYIRIVATKDETALVYDPPQPGAPMAIAKAGEFITIQNNKNDFEVIANHPIVVGHYMRGQGTDGDPEQGVQFPDQGSGDPSLALAVAKDQYRKHYLFHAPTNYDSNYVNIIAPNGTSVTLDGKQVTGFSPIGTTGWSVARKQLNNDGDGNHTVSSPMEIGIMVYGFGAYTSFMYPGGLNLKILHD